MDTKIAKWSLIGLVAALAVTSAAYRLIVYTGYDYSSLLFIGIPALLAAMLIMAPNMTSPSAQVFRGITIFLLIVGVMAWEGAICIIMAAPLFYLVGFTILGLFKLANGRNKIRSIALFPIGLIALEGVHHSLSFERENEVVIHRDIPLSEGEFLERLSKAPTFDMAPPAIFRLGFPVPLIANANGTYTTTGKTEYLFRFTGPEEMENELKVLGEWESPRRIDFVFPQNTTKLNSWMSWESACMTWETSGDGLRLTFRQNYRRKLDPYWYFSPIQNYAVKLAGHHLLNAWFDE